MDKYLLIVALFCIACSQEQTLKDTSNTVTIPTVLIEGRTKQYLFQEAVDGAMWACSQAGGTVSFSERNKSTCYKSKSDLNGFHYEGTCIWDMEVSCISDEEGTECYWVRTSCYSLIKP